VAGAAAKRRSVRVRVAAASALVAAGVAVFFLTRGPDTSIPEPRALAGYRVTYRVEDRTRPRVRVTTQVLEVHRPWSSRVEDRAGAPPGEAVVKAQITNGTHLWGLKGGGVLQFGVVRPPGGPGRDVSLRVLRDAVADGFAEVAGQDEILGRRCTRFVVGSPITEALVTPGSDRFEYCVTPTGIVLREEWAFGGRTARVAEAVRVTERPPSDERFLIGRIPTRNETVDLLGLQSLVQDTTDLPPLRIAMDLPPDWEVERSAVVADSGGLNGTPSQVVSLAFRRGSDVVVVERSTPQERLRPTWDPSDGDRIDLGDDGGPGRIVYFLDRVEVRLVGEVGYARVVAPSKALGLRFARLLRPSR
jgi:hypothetical protein